MSRTFKSALEDALKDPEFREAYEALEPEYQLRRALILLRQRANLTQTQLAERLGTHQEYISRIEGGKTRLTLAYFAQLVHAMNADLEVSLQPKDGSEPIKTKVIVG